MSFNSVAAAFRGSRTEAESSTNHERRVVVGAKNPSTFFAGLASVPSHLKIKSEHFGTTKTDALQSAFNVASASIQGGRKENGNYVEKECGAGKNMTSMINAFVQALQKSCNLELVAHRGMDDADEYGSHYFTYIITSKFNV
jgi:hypothetical protein